MMPTAKSVLLFSAFAVSILIGFVVADPTPSIISISPDQVRNVSESADLNCTVENVELNSVFWTKKVGEGFVILSMGKTLSVPDPRIQLSVVNGSYILKFLQIEYNDSSTYTCEVTTSNTNKLSKQVQLIVRTPPKISESLVQNPAPFALNSSTSLNCMSNGYPTATVHWARKNGDPMPNGAYLVKGQTLTFNNVQPNDRGMYVCVADNGYGTDTKSVVVDVKFAPIITAPRPKVAQRLHFGIELECTVEAFPAPAIAWYRDGVKIDTSSDQQIHISAAENQNTISVLHLKSLTSKQYGDYVCQATNSEGQAETRINVYPQDLANINFSGLMMSPSSAHVIHASSLFVLFTATIILRSFCGY